MSKTKFVTHSSLIKADNDQVEIKSKVNKLLLYIQKENVQHFGNWKFVQVLIFKKIFIKYLFQWV